MWFFSIMDLYFLISAVIAQIFISIAELTTPRGTPINEANAEIKRQPDSKNENEKIFKVI